MTAVAEPEVAYTSVSSDGTDEIDVDETGQIIESRGFEDENAVPATDPVPDKGMEAFSAFVPLYDGIYRLLASTTARQSVKTPDANKVAELAAHYAFQFALLSIGVR